MDTLRIKYTDGNGNSLALAYPDDAPDTVEIELAIGIDLDAPAGELVLTCALNAGGSDFTAAGTRWVSQIS